VMTRWMKSTNFCLHVKWPSCASYAMRPEMVRLAERMLRCYKAKYMNNPYVCIPAIREALYEGTRSRSNWDVIRI
jgi:hypothetical protein